MQYETQSRNAHLRSESQRILGFYLKERDIEANPDKCETVLHMEAPTTNKRVMKLNGMLKALNRFILKLVHQTLPFYKLLKK